MECTLHAQTTGNLQRFALKGGLTIYGAADIKQAFMRQYDHRCQVQVSLREIDEIDSAGLQLLYAFKAFAATKNTDFSLTDHSSAVLEAMELLGMTALFGDPVLMPARADLAEGGEA
ncbi:STAS domain-containing protein [Motiliproteus sediminis]|uniref:STAS domain-containing protein n=1 Tax=Motiliproteus sediminis TaxID=1468178 RepID=UPI001AEF8D19|nr:STAS domain-containing protein [Motiliproteus sediminis]